MTSGSARKERARPPEPDEAVYPADPLRLLESVPELELFLTDRRVRGGIERGRPHDVYRALFWARLWGRFARHRHVLAALLGDRRLFVAPLRGAPAMFTYNGVGLSVYGSAEQRADGAYIGTHYVVFLFVPVFPLGSYLMAHGGGNSYRFFGKAPFGTLDWIFNRLVVLGAVGAVLMGLGSSVIASRYADVHVVNGLPVPIVADVCGTRRVLEPDERTEVTAPVGTCRMTAWLAADPAAPPIETTSLPLEPGHDLIAWNVLGLSPIYDEVVVYGTGYGGPPAVNLHCGEPLIVLDRVDHPFTEPPTSVSLPRHGGYATRTHVEVAPPGSVECLGEMLTSSARGSPERGRALEVASVLAAAAGHAPERVLDLARDVELVEELEAALALVDAARAVHAGTLELEIEHQNLMGVLGRRGAALAEARARAEAAPADADLGYLGERLDASPGAVERWHALHARFPDHTHILAAVGHALCDALRAGEGAAVFDELEALDPELAEERRATRARCLFAAGRGPAARALVEDAFHRADPGLERVTLAVLHRDISAALSPPISSALFDAMGPDERAALEPLYRGMARLPPTGPSDDPSLAPLIAVLDAARTDPARAAALFAGLEGWTRALVPADLLILLAGERPDLPLLASFGPEMSDALLGFVVNGTSSDILDDEPRELRAAACFARSRRPGLTDEERAELVRRAHELDTIPTWIRTAEEGWPR